VNSTNSFDARPAAKKTVQKSKYGWVAPTIITTVLILGGLFILAIATSSQGQVHGIEFCPQTFSVRTYDYMRIPLIGIQVTPTDRLEQPVTLRQTLKSMNINVTRPSDPKDWQTVEVRSGSKVYPGKAAVLKYYLDLSDSFFQSGDWESWTTAHPKKAAIVWPAVAELACENQHWRIPEVFDAACTDMDLDTLRGTVDEIVGKTMPVISPSDTDVDAEIEE
jgi:hypothetical protein